MQGTVSKLFQWSLREGVYIIAQSINVLVLIHGVEI